MGISTFFKGFYIVFRSRKMFRPEYQVRTDAITDLVKQKSKEEEAEHGTDDCLGKMVKKPVR